MTKEKYGAAYYWATKSDATKQELRAALIAADRKEQRSARELKRLRALCK